MGKNEHTSNHAGKMEAGRYHLREEKAIRNMAHKRNDESAEMGGVSSG